MTEDNTPSTTAITDEERLLRQIFGEDPNAAPVRELVPVVHPVDDCHRLTAGHLREMIASLPDDAPVYYHRIEDVYFDKHQWRPDVVLDETNSRDESTHGDYIRAYACFRRKENDALYITAHY